MSTRYPCPSCGHHVFDETPGSFDICSVCTWEDDRVQLRWPTIPGGANRISLVEAQRNYRDFSACDDRGRTHARSPEADEPLDPAWRPIDPARDHFEDPRTGLRQPWPDDPTTLYWWLPTFWRRNAHNK
ncbi:CPCC family cysteine-rich protein [Nocardia sp. NBC_01329]|uniref:CPCC family cysteine-rich protein n=1 Tax=Nocardia sp. NBC_01329 TaxID=2903594 RepID=UPI002E10FE17|nr:CPCC family cysteine-rich protein [Nocardia sp. NBC_01329]